MRFPCIHLLLFFVIVDKWFSGAFKEFCLIMFMKINIHFNSYEG